MSTWLRVHMHRTKLVFDKLIYLGFTILDLSKTLMTDFVYDYLKPLYGDRANICYTNTGSLICNIRTADAYKDMDKSAWQWFEASYYPEGYAIGIRAGVNKKFKDECAG